MEMSVRQDNDSDDTTTSLQDILYVDPPAPSPAHNSKKKGHKPHKSHKSSETPTCVEDQDVLFLDPLAPASTHNSKNERQNFSDTTTSIQDQDVLFLDSPTPAPTHNNKKERHKSSDTTTCVQDNSFLEPTAPSHNSTKERHKTHKSSDTTTCFQYNSFLDPTTVAPTHNSKKERHKSHKYSDITTRVQNVLFFDPPTHNSKKERHKSHQSSDTTISAQDIPLLDPPAPTPAHNNKKERHKSHKSSDTAACVQDVLCFDPPTLAPTHNNMKERHESSGTTTCLQDFLSIDPPSPSPTLSPSLSPTPAQTQIPTPTPTHDIKKEQQKSSGTTTCLRDHLFIDPPSPSPSPTPSPSLSPTPTLDATTTSTPPHNSKEGNKSSGITTCLQDILFLDPPSPTPTSAPAPTPTPSHSNKKERHKSSGPQKKLEKLLIQSCNKVCADCGSPDPKWVSLNCGVFICIKCSGIHRSLGVHISKVLSINLDDWAEEQVAAFLELGGNNAANRKYEACLPDDYKKPKPDASIDDRFEFIRRKYEQLEFLNSNDQMICSYRPHKCSGSSNDKRHYEKQPTTRHRIGHAFRNSWGRKESEIKAPKKNSTITVGMVEFIGLIKVNVVKGTNLAVRDVVTSDPYVILALGHQSVRTRVIKNNLNPVWNERLMLSIPEHIPPLKVLVYDKDTFSTDDFMGEAEIDIQPLVRAAKAYETSTINETMQLGKWVASKDNTLVKDGVITLVDGNVKQEISLRLQNVERGILEIELECVPLTQ